MADPSSKRRKTSCDSIVEEEEPATFDLLALYRGDFGKQILSYASACDLCALDAVSAQFQRMTDDRWNFVTERTFGMKNGKDGWRVGCAFLREPVYIYMCDDGDFGYGDHYAGSPSVTANESMVVAVSDDVEGNVWSRTFPDERQGIGIRDAHTLNYIRTVPSPISNWNVAICGRAGSENIVTTNSRHICARRGNDLQLWRCAGRDGSCIPAIGCETHLIVADGDAILIYRVKTAEAGERRGTSQLLSLRKKLDANSGHDTMKDMAWGPDKSDFVCCYPNQISVWNFDAPLDMASLAKTIVTTGLRINNAALAHNYIAASSEKKLHVWDRSTGGKLHVLCDVDEDDELEEEYTEYSSLSMSCHGHILVSTSHIGCALCVWNIKTGELLRRHNHADEERSTDVLPDGVDTSDMTFLEHLNAFCVMASCMHVWAFPANEKQGGMAKSIFRREERLSRACLLE